MTIKTSDEGTSYCPSCESYAKKIEKLEAENQDLREDQLTPDDVKALNEKMLNLEAKNRKMRKALEKIKWDRTENLRNKTSAAQISEDALADGGEEGK